MSWNIPEEAYREIEASIHSEESPVGIDPLKTHVVILYKLGEIERRLDRIESRLDGTGTSG